MLIIRSMNLINLHFWTYLGFTHVTHGLGVDYEDGAMNFVMCSQNSCFLLHFQLSHHLPRSFENIKSQ